jgi:four helix bundle protein
MSIRSYQDLEVWQKAIGLAIECYQLAKRFPADERYGLVTQLRRAAVSVASNIAEGHERRGTREFLHHLSISRGSLGEVDTCLELAGRLDYATKDQLALARQLVDDISRMVSRLRQSLAPRATKRAPAPRASHLGPH